MLLEDLRLAPPSRPVELGDQAAFAVLERLLELHFVDPVLERIQRVAEVAAGQTRLFHRLEHQLGGELKEEVRGRRRHVRQLTALVVSDRARR